MRGLRLNGPLRIGLVLLAGLLLLLVLPELLPLRHPQLAQLNIVTDEGIRSAPYGPGEHGFILGTDILGRDRLSRLIYGARVTLGTALLITVLRGVLAIPLGLLAGWYKGWLSRLVSVLGVSLGAIPVLILVSLILAGLRMMITNPVKWLLTFVCVVTIIGLPRMAEHVRMRTREISLQAHVEAAIALGAPSSRIMLRHLLPLMTTDLLIMLAAEMSWALLLMGQLAVFGIYVGGTGVVLGESGLVPRFVAEYWPEWAMMLGHSRSYILSQAWIPLLPGIALAMSAGCFHLLAEGLRLRSLGRTRA